MNSCSNVSDKSIAPKKCDVNTVYIIFSMRFVQEQGRQYVVECDIIFFEKSLDKSGVVGYNNKASFANGARRVRRRVKRILHFGEVLKLAEEAPLLRV